MLLEFSIDVSSSIKFRWSCIESLYFIVYFIIIIIIISLFTYIIKLTSCSYCKCYTQYAIRYTLRVAPLRTSRIVHAHNPVIMRHTVPYRIVPHRAPGKSPNLSRKI